MTALFSCLFHLFRLKLLAMLNDGFHVRLCPLGKSDDEGNQQMSGVGQPVFSIIEFFAKAYRKKALEFFRNSKAFLRKT